MLDFLSTKNKVYLALMAGLLVLNVITLREVIFLASPHYLRVDVLDIGQGDSIFIRTPALRTIIIDGGPDAAVLEKLAGRLPFWQKSLDMIILTHPDADHMAGLLEILERYRVGYIVWTGIIRSGGHYQQWLSLLEKAKRKGSNVIIAQAGTSIVSGGAVIDVVHPFKNAEGVFFDQTNEMGIVSRLTYGTKAFLFTADVSDKIEERMLQQHAVVAANVLKVGHHGSKYSTSEAFLRAVHPEIAVISAGVKNSYGHPTPEVLQRLQEFGISTLRTDQSGDAIFLSDGQNIQLMKR